MQNVKDICIAIADDHQLIIDGLKSLLKSENRFKVVGEASNGEEMKTILSKVHVDVLLTDIKMPIVDGLELTRWTREQYPDVKIVALSMFHHLSLVKKILKAGANGYILKNTGRDELFTCIYSVMKNKPYFSDEISEKMMRSMMLQGNDEEKSEVLPIALTKRELEILELIVGEHTSAEIAGQLFISINTVETHRKNLLHKLQVKNTVGLVKYAYEHRLFN